jgi:molecular chaperone DnaJ
VIREPCGGCRGGGYVLEKIAREIKIPAGVDVGTRLRLRGEGEPSPDGGPRGDCYVIIDIEQHSLFQRDGANLVCQVPIHYAQLALGSEIEVPSLNGPEKLTIPSGTQSGEIFRLRGRGMPVPHQRARGDLIVQVYLEVPKRLSSDHERLLRELAEIENRDVTPERKSFFSKVKDYFQAD